MTTDHVTPDHLTTDASIAEQADAGDVDALQAKIARDRMALADSVAVLSDRMDVKTRARNRVAQVREQHGTELLAGAGALVLLVAVTVVVRRRR